MLYEIANVADWIALGEFYRRGYMKVANLHFRKNKDRRLQYFLVETAGEGAGTKFIQRYKR